MLGRGKGFGQIDVQQQSQAVPGFVIRLRSGILPVRCGLPGEEHHRSELFLRDAFGLSRLADELSDIRGDHSGFSSFIQA